MVSVGATLPVLPEGTGDQAGDAVQLTVPAQPSAISVMESPVQIEAEAETGGKVGQV